MLSAISQKRLFLLDLDGTLYLDDVLFEGTLPFLSRVSEIGGRALFLTNNSSRGADAYVAKMARLGIRAFSSVDAAGGMPDSPRTTALADGVRSIQKMALSNARVLFYGGNEFLREPELVRDQLKRAAEILSH